MLEPPPIVLHAKAPVPSSKAASPALVCLENADAINLRSVNAPDRECVAAVLEPAKLVIISFTEKINYFSFFASPCCSTNSMNIIIRVFGNLIIVYMRHVVNMKPSSCNVSADKHYLVSLFELLDSLGALVL